MCVCGLCVCVRGAFFLTRRISVGVLTSVASSASAGGPSVGEASATQGQRSLNFTAPTPSVSDCTLAASHSYIHVWEGGINIHMSKQTPWQDSHIHTLSLIHTFDTHTHTHIEPQKASNHKLKDIQDVGQSMIILHIYHLYPQEHLLPVLWLMTILALFISKNLRTRQQQNGSDRQ